MPVFDLGYVQRILRALDPMIAGAVAQAASGSSTDYAQYRDLVGYIRGLRHARDEVIAPFSGRDRDQLDPAP